MLFSALSLVGSLRARNAVYYMLFNSIPFIVFLVIVYAIYTMIRRRRQNLLLLVASYVFYGSWNWKFLSLIVVSTLVDFFCGQFIERSPSERTRKRLLALSVIVNLGILGFFKYFNFFVDSFGELLGAVGATPMASRLNIVLPVGISFYTFQTMSYTIEVYRRKIAAEKSLADFALYVAFFPQLVAGPIERASRLLPQFKRDRVVTMAQRGEALTLIIWGYYKKVFVADNLALIVNRVFATPAAEQSSLEILLGVYAFAFQIYCDFSGYTDIARGIAKLMGFDLMINFRLPYFARDPAEFWRRWHISLSTWLRDYLYIPLGGNRRGNRRTYLNLGLTMLLGGLWHGAAWTFVLWGGYQGALLMVHRFVKGRFRPVADGSLARAVKTVLMFQLVCLGWLIFRADSFGQLSALFMRLFSRPDVTVEAWTYFSKLVFYIAPLMAVQVWQYRSGQLTLFPDWSPTARAYVGVFLLLSILCLGQFGGHAFIYFQF